ncbi:hypothetical protein SADUNF_Sadunf07G0058200 [Salix dunnii]|uniref:Uncharacterized protein n=1 Tax=Salix dunnii TaxID=1413687 RepID=A0A835JVV7_9ROSI|nr:hypothetical protein SADUNF_Sadunf07G0058200 [Salix dunnii]
MDRSHEVSLDINEIATSLRDQLKTKKVFSSTCCIYKVPETLWESNEKAYAPRIVSIGPIHHGKENLKAMEDHKITYLRQFLEQSELPFFILEELLKRYSAADANPRNHIVNEITSQFLLEDWVKEDRWKTVNSSEVLYFVDFLRKRQQPTERSCEERKTAILSAPTTTTELHQS